MKKLYTNFLMSLLGLFMAVSASAQADFTGRSVQSPAEDYSTQPIVFSLSEVAAKLNTNAADLVSALDTWAENYDHEAEEQEGNMLFLQDGTGASGLNDAYTATGTHGYAGCFWMSKDVRPLLMQTVIGSTTSIGHLPRTTPLSLLSDRNQMRCSLVVSLKLPLS